MTDQTFSGVRREELVQRKLVRQGWLVLAIGFVVPFLCLWAVGNGRRLLHAGNAHGWPLIVLGLTIGIGRAVLYLTHTWPN
jgi:hypothetical protein